MKSYIQKVITKAKEMVHGVFVVFCQLFPFCDNLSKSV